MVYMLTFGYIWGILMVNVTIYIAYMDPMGDGIHWDFTNNRHGGFSGDLSNKHGGLMGIESTNMVDFT